MSSNDFVSWISSGRVMVQGTQIGYPDTPALYVPYTALKEYWQHDRIQPFLRRLNLPIDIIQRRFLRIFSILVYISHPGSDRFEYIESFLHRDAIDDHNLPFESGSFQTLPFAKTPDGKLTIKNFCEYQFMFHPVSLGQSLPHKKQLLDGCILPITGRQVLAGGRGSGAILSKYTLQESSDLAVPKNTIVVKEFSSDELEYTFPNEVEAYTVLWNNRKLGETCKFFLKYYGSLIQNGTGVVLLEYADRGSLLDFFGENDLPHTPEELYCLWASLAELFKGLAILHNLDQKNNSFLMGVHQDLKPANIFVFSKGGESKYSFSFKIGDFGLSSINLAKQKSKEFYAPDNKATKTYGAPELTVTRPDFDNLDRWVTWDADIWAIGCVLFETAVWTVCGERGREEFLEDRETETKDMPEHRKQGYGSSFHNGIKMLHAVEVMRTKILERKRIFDGLTGRIMTFLTDELLLPKDNKRLNAETAVHRLLKILQSQESPRLSFPSHNFPFKNGMVASHSPVSSKLPKSYPQAYCRHQNTSSSSQGRLSCFQPEGDPFDEGDPEHSRRNSSMSHIQPLEALQGQRGPGIRDSEYYLGSNDNRDGNWPVAGRDSLSAVRQGSMSGIRANLTPANRDPDHHAILENKDRDPLPQTIKPEPLRGPSQRRATQGEHRSAKRESDYQQLYNPEPGLDPSKPPAQGAPPQVKLAEQPPEEVPVTNEPTSAQAQRLVPTHKSSYPYVTVQDALKWIPRFKADRAAKLEGREDALRLLKNRDMVFFVDNSESMSQHWDMVKQTFRALAYLAKTVDPDKMELRFTADPIKRYQSRDTTILLNHFTPMKPSSGPCVMEAALSILLKDVVDRAIKASQPKSMFGFKQQKPAVQGVCVFIFTNGVWEADQSSQSVDLCRVDKAILSVVQNLLKNDKERTFLSLQFIRFGNVGVGKKNLKYLDDELEKYLDKKVGKEIGWDIADTRFHAGSVWPMMVGSLSREDLVEDASDAQSSHSHEEQGEQEG